MKRRLPEIKAMLHWTRKEVGNLKRLEREKLRLDKNALMQGRKQKNTNCVKVERKISQASINEEGQERVAMRVACE